MSLEEIIAFDELKKLLEEHQELTYINGIIYVKPKIVAHFNNDKIVKYFDSYNEASIFLDNIITESLKLIKF